MNGYVLGVLLLIGLLVARPFACTNNHATVKRVLENDGYTDVWVGGYAWFACGERDYFSNKFRGKKNGSDVRGAVCGGLLKNMTIRISK